MGKKKGRQRGAFATKAQRAAHQTLLRERASEADGARRPYRGGWSSSSASLGHSPSKPASGIRCGGGGGGERPRVSVSLSQLRGILAERRLQDRALEGEMRRFLSQQGTTVRSESAGRYAALMRLRDRGSGSAAGEDGAVCGDASTPGHQPGWLLTYDHERDFVPNESAAAVAVAAATTTTTAEDGGEIDASGDPSASGDGLAAVADAEGCALPPPRRPPSLQSLCVSSLAPALDDYVESCGPDAVRSVLDLMPPHVLADLSALYCSQCVGGRGGVGDEMAAVLGGHGQAVCLALHARVDDEEEEEEAWTGAGGEEVSTAEETGRRRLTDAGLLSLAPRLDARAPDSWEDLDDVEYHPAAAASARLEGCADLRRLELCRARRVSAPALCSLLRRCSRITHLSLAGSLDAESGPAALLDPMGGVGTLLTDLKVLDLSRCAWLTDGVLGAFLLKARSSEATLSSLEMVSVSGCPGVTLAAVEELNGRLGGTPYVSTVVQRRPRSCVAQREEEEEEREARRRAADSGAGRPAASRGELVAVKRWRDKRSRGFGGRADALSSCEDVWREGPGVVAPSISAS